MLELHAQADVCECKESVLGRVSCERASGGAHCDNEYTSFQLCPTVNKPLIRKLLNLTYFVLWLWITRGWCGAIVEVHNIVCVWIPFINLCISLLPNCAQTHKFHSMDRLLVQLTADGMHTRTHTQTCACTRTHTHTHLIMYLHRHMLILKPLHRRQASLDVLESMAAQGVLAYSWSADVWPRKSFKPNYRIWKQQRPEHRAPLSAPARVAPLPEGLDAGVCVCVYVCLCVFVGVPMCVIVCAALCLQILLFKAWL